MFFFLFGIIFEFKESTHAEAASLIKQQQKIYERKERTQTEAAYNQQLKII